MEIRVKRVMLDEDGNLAHSYNSTDELYHWGIKGMKWGVRRYQNKDGSLTAAGRKRQSLGQYIHDKKVAKKRKEAAAKARETKAKNAEEKAKRERLLAKGKIPVKKMTDEELKRSMERLNNEKMYLEKKREVSAFEQFKHKAVREMVIPAVTETGKSLAKQYLEDQGKKLLGIGQKSAYDKLKEAADSAKLKREMYENEQALDNAKKNRELNDAVTKAKAEADLARSHKNKVVDDRQAYNQSKDFNAEKDTDKKYKKSAEKNAKKAVDEYNEYQQKLKEDYSNAKTENTRYSKKGSEINDAVYETGKTRAKNEIEARGNNTVDTVNKSNVKEGVAWVESSSGEFLNTTWYKEEK